MNRRPFLAGLFACVTLVALVALARTDQTVLYEKASAYGTIVVTEEENGVRTLLLEICEEPWIYYRR